MRIALFFSLLLAALAVTFTLLNTQTVEVNFGYAMVRSQLAVVLMVTLVAGVLIGFLASLPARLKAYQRAYKAEKQLAELGTAMKAAPATAAASPEATETQRLADEVTRRAAATAGTAPPQL